MKNLRLNLKAVWYNLIESGEKKEEYREIKPYYVSRFYSNYISGGGGLEWVLNNNPKVYKEIIFRNGYRKDSPKIKCYCCISKGKGKPELGAKPNKLYYVLKILSVEEVK